MLATYGSITIPWIMLDMMVTGDPIKLHVQKTHYVTIYLSAEG